MRRFLLAAVLSLAAAPAFAVTLPGLHTGMVLVDAANQKVGDIDQINTDGSVGVVMDGAYAVVPADTLSMQAGRPVTKLTRKQVESLVAQGN